MITPNLFTAEEADSPFYTWREKKMKVFIFSTTKYADGKGPECCKHIETDKNGISRDVDIQRMKKEFIGDEEKFNSSLRQSGYTVDMEEIINEKIAKKESLIAELEKMHTEESLREYDCFFFMFFTFLASRRQTGGQYMLRLGLRDENISIHDILDKIKTVTYFHGKPKVFLIQADDLSLIQGEQGTKGDTKPFEVIERKIPVDADRLIIESRIPQKIRLNDEKNGENGSFLVQAFLEAFNYNMKRRDEEKLDLLSLSVEINKAVKEKIKDVKSPGLRAKLTYPLVTSTLRKFLYL